MPLSRFRRKKSHQPSPHPAPPRIGGELSLTDTETDEVVLTISASENDTAGFPTKTGVLQDDSRGRRSHGDDLAREGASRPTDDGLREHENDKEILSNISDHYHIVSTPGLSKSNEGGVEVLNLRGYDQQEVVVEQPREKQASHVEGDAPSPVQSNRSELVGEASGDGAAKSIARPVGEAADRLGSLKVLLSALHPDSEEATLVGKKIEGLLSRVTALEEFFDSKPSDIAEQRRRDGVVRELNGIERQLRSLPIESHGEDDGVYMLLEDVRETIFNYQAEQQETNYSQKCKNINRDEVAVLNSSRCAPEAEFRHGDRKGCLKGTRQTVLDEIELWTRDFTAPPVYWLNGLAGTGKTTITQTVAERTFADGQLGASFFCSRHCQDRSNLRLIFPTLAVQLARRYTDFRSHFVPLIQSDPGIAYESLYNQMRKLIVEPLRESKISTVIVIDALDECVDEEPASAILSVLGRSVSEIPNVKFFVTGRPEPRILGGFRLPLLADAADVFVLHEVESSQVEKDISLFFKHEFGELVRRHRGLDGWPTEDQLDLLCKRAAGLFVYAVATVKFVDKRGTNPREQLDLLLRSPENSAREARTRFNANSTLDSLYISILQGAFGDQDDPDNDPKIPSVFGAVVLAATPLSPSTIAKLLGLDPRSVFLLLSSAQSLLILHEDINHPAKPFHKSFPDFLVDPDRCKNQRFHVSPPHHHSQLLVRCLDLMDQTLEKDMCKLPDAVINTDVSDMKSRTERYINPALQYACKSWHTHLVDEDNTLVPASDITSTLHRFLETKFLFWLEVLSVLGVVRNAVDALQVVVSWLEESPTLDLAHDCSRFISAYFETISASSSHIYHSALALASKTSIVRKLYNSHARPFIRVIHGLPVSWDSYAAATTHPSSIELVAWSPCSRFIAISPSGSMTVDVLDSVILQKLQHLKLKFEFLEDGVCPGTLVFSPDGRMLTSSGGSLKEAFVVSWDLQIGGIAGVIRWKSPGTGIHITYSANGKMVAVIHRNWINHVISICDVVSSEHLRDVHLQSNPALCKVWSVGESFRVATLGRTTSEASEPTPSITVWELGLTAETTTVVETIPVPEGVHISESDEMCFPQYTIRPQAPQAPYSVALAYDTRHPRVLIWDAHNSEILLDQDGGYLRHPTFSSDGRFFACSTSAEIHLWKYSSTGYVLYGKLPFPTAYFAPLLSPNGESIIVFGGSMITLWHTRNLAATPSDSLVEPAPRQTGDFILEFHPDRPLAAVARQRDGTVTLLDLNSGAPQSTINTEVDIQGLGVKGKTIVVIDENGATTWKLPGGTGTTMGRLDCTRSVSLEGGDVTTGVLSPDSRYIATVQDGELTIRCATSGEYLCSDKPKGGTLWFVPDGRNIGSVVGGDKGWVQEIKRITTDGTLQCQLGEGETFDIGKGQWGCPYRSSRGYRVTDDGWIFGPSGKRLLILPPLWKLGLKEGQRKWNRQFLALLHGSLPEPVILELEP